MFQKKYFKIELLFFYLLLVFNLINVWSVDIYISLDGPSHLYNSSILNFIDTSGFLNEYYVQNEFFLPNYLAHIILAKLQLVFDPFISEKIFLSAIVIFLPLSFRSAIKHYSVHSNELSFLIFTLVFTFLFHLGFFSFSFAFILFNVQLILTSYFLNNKINWWICVLFAVTCVALFYTHPFVFVVSMPALGFLCIVKFRTNLKELLKKAAWLIGLSLPSLILFLLFYTNIRIRSAAEVGDPDITTYNKFLELFSFGLGVAYAAGIEGIYSSLIAILFIFLISSILTSRFFTAHSDKQFHLSDVFLVFSIIVLIAIFYTHNAGFGGMFTNRLTFLFFYFLVFWLCCNKIHSKAIIFSSLFLVLFSYINLSFLRYKVFEAFSPHAREINGASQYIADRSVVMPMNFSDNWFEAHFSDYAGIGKEVVMTKNYEAGLGWFPLKWKEEKLSRVKCQIDSTNNIILPDYILIYGSQEKIDHESMKDLKNFIAEHANKCYESEGKFCTLYKLNK